MKNSLRGEIKFPIISNFSMTNNSFVRRHFVHCCAYYYNSVLSTPSISKYYLYKDYRYYFIKKNSNILTSLWSFIRQFERLTVKTNVHTPTFNFSITGEDDNEPSNRIEYLSRDTSFRGDKRMSELTDLVQKDQRDFNKSIAQSILPRNFRCSTGYFLADLFLGKDYIPLAVFSRSGEIGRRVKFGGRCATAEQKEGERWNKARRVFSR